MPLTMAMSGERKQIRSITGKDETRRHLAQLGFVVGAEVTVVSKLSGNMILALKDSRIALDSSMTNRILI